LLPWGGWWHVGIAERLAAPAVLCQRAPSGSLFEGFVSFTSLARFREQQGLVPASTSSGSRTNSSRLELDHHLTMPDVVSLGQVPAAPRAAFKAHVLLDHDDYLPATCCSPRRSVANVKLANSFVPESRPMWPSIAAISTTPLFGRLEHGGVFFVTRLKDNAAFEVVEECEIPQNRNIRADQLIRLHRRPAKPTILTCWRRIVAWDAENEREIVLLTNLLEFGSTTIAAIYKERWKIETVLQKRSSKNLT